MFDLLAPGLSGDIRAHRSLYTIDLSDPADPYIVGELEVTGFSNFLHPVSDDLLLGLGQSEDNQVKLELFDISDFAAPVSRGA